jgi:hypothetical protein
MGRLESRFGRIAYPLDPPYHTAVVCGEPRGRDARHNGRLYEAENITQRGGRPIFRNIKVTEPTWKESVYIYLLECLHEPSVAGFVVVSSWVPWRRIIRRHRQPMPLKTASSNRPTGQDDDEIPYHRGKGNASEYCKRRLVHQFWSR